MKKISYLIVFILILAGKSSGGDLEPPGDPQSIYFYNLNDIYNRLDDGTAGSQSPFLEPSAGPGSTGHTIDDIMYIAPQVNGSGADAAKVLDGYWFWGLLSGTWGLTEGTMVDNGSGSIITPGTSSQSIPAGYWSSANIISGDANLSAGNIKNGVKIFRVTGTYQAENAYQSVVTKTGQTTSYATGDDGDMQKGSALLNPRFTDNSDFKKSVAWSSQRFTDNRDGTITDNLTGLIWLKNANAGGAMNWADALSYCNSLENGNAGLSDGSSAGDWRLPNINELLSLADFSNYNPVLPSGHPFFNVNNSC